MKNAEYWRSRFALLEAGTHEKSDRYLAALEKVYQETAISVQKEIDAWYGRFAKNNQISLSDAKKWLSTKEREEFRWTVEQYIKIGKQKGLSADWLRKLENASTKFHISRLEAVQMQIQQQMELLFGNQVDELDMLLREVVSEGYTKGAFTVQKGIGLGWDLTTIPQNKLDLLLEKPWTNDGKTFRDRCWSDKSNLIEGIQKALIQGMLRGDGLQKTSAVIQKQFGVAQWKAARLVHTETTYFNAVARKQMYQDFKIKQMEIVETLDSHTCTICRPLDGTVLTISQYEPGVTVPPFHPHCRGTTCPYYADMEGVRTARSKDGTVYHVPDDMTYEDWKKSFLNGGKKDELESVDNQSLTKKRNYNNDFGKKFGKAHYDNIRDRVDICENGNLRRVWEVYEGHIKVANAHQQGVSYCKEDCIYVNIDIDSKGRAWSKPYATIFHESGHVIDRLTYKMGIDNGQRHFSSTYKDGLFPKTIRKEVDDWIKSIFSDMKAHHTDFQYWVKQGWITQEQAKYYASDINFKPKTSMAFDAVKKLVQSLDIFQMCDISDILEGATRGRIVCGIGHGTSYWKDRCSNGIDWGLGAEAFAEITSAFMANSESLETIKKYLPKSFALYEEMIEVIANQF